MPTRNERFATGAFVNQPGQFACGVAIQSYVTASFSTSALIEGPGVYERRLLNDVTTGESIPNDFYGVTATDSFTLDLSNLDGELSHLLEEEIYGASVRIRRYDVASGEVLPVMHGIVGDYSVGETTQLKVENKAITTLDIQLPRRIIQAQDVTATDLSPSDIPVPFANPIDVGTPVNIILGEARYAICRQVAKNDITSSYDYVVGEDIITVHQVYKDGVAAYENQTLLAVVGLSYWSAPDSTKHQTRIDCGTMSATVLQSLSLTGFYIRFLMGNNAEQAYYITEEIRVDTGTKDGSGNTIYHLYLEIADYNLAGYAPTQNPDGSWSVPGEVGNKLGIFEYAVLQNTQEYPGITVLRFRRPQTQDENPRQITADCSRYHPPIKNLLLSSEVRYTYPIRDDRLPTSTGTTAELEGWTRYGNAEISLAGRDPRSSKRGIEVSGKSASPTNRYIQQNVNVVPREGEAFTFSVFWMRTPSHNIVLELTSNGAGATTTTQTFLTSQFSAFGTAGYPRIHVSKSTGWGTTPTQIIVRIRLEDSGIKYARVYGMQLERAETPTWYEPVFRAKHGAGAWSFADTIREILVNPTWGLGQEVDEESFANANNALFDLDLAGKRGAGPYLSTMYSRYYYSEIPMQSLGLLAMRACGVLPDLNGTRYTAKEVIDELCRARGLRIENASGAWVIHAPSAGAAVQGVFGTEETAFANCFDVSEVKKVPLDERVQTLKARWGQTLGQTAESGVQVYFRASTEAHNIHPTGVIREIENHFIQDEWTAWVATNYMAGIFTSQDRTVTVTLGQEARRLQLDDLITWYGPRFQPSNLVIGSEALYDTNRWLPYGTASVTQAGPGTKLDPFHRNYANGAVTIGPTGAGEVGGVGQTITFDTTDYVAGKTFTAYIWVQTTTESNGYRLRLETLGGTPEIFTTTFFPGIGQWQRFKISHTFTNAASGNLRFSVFLDQNKSGGYLDLWGAHVFEGAYRQLTAEATEVPYVKTTTTPIQSVTTYRIRDLKRSGVTSTTVILTPYDEDEVFSGAYVRYAPVYTALSTPTDPRSQPPGLPSPLIVPTTEGPAMWRDVHFLTVTFTAIVQWVQPATANFEGVRVQKRTLGNSELPGNELAAWEDVTTILSAEAPAGTLTQALLSGLHPDTAYVIRVYSFNKYNIYNGLAQQANLITPA